MNLIVDFLVYFFNLPIFEMLLFGVRLMFLLLLLLVLTRTWRTVYHWHIRPSLKKWLPKARKMKKTPKQLLNHYFAQVLFFYNKKQTTSDPFCAMYENMFWGAKSMIELLSDDADLKNRAENFGDFLNEINHKTQKEIAEMLEQVKVDL